MSVRSGGAGFAELEELGRLRWAFGEVLELAEQAPGLTNGQLCYRLQMLAGVLAPRGRGPCVMSMQSQCAGVEPVATCATWLVARSDAPFSTGETCRAHWWVPPAPELADAASVPGARFSEEGPTNGWWVSGIVTVVSAEDDPAGGVFRAQVRAATATEAVVVLRDEPPSYQRREELVRRAGELLSWGGDATVLDDVTSHQLAPLAVLTLPEVPLRDLAGGTGRLRLDREKRLLWTVAATADATAGNCGCFVALEHPLTPEREGLVRDLFAEHSTLDAWCKEGYTRRAAQVLVLSGWSRAAVREEAGALSLRATRDAEVFATRTFDWWVDHGWCRRAGTYGGVPASEAVRLAEAGVTCKQAGALHAAGFATREAKLAARPPRLPVTRGRFMLYAGSLGTSAATDDPKQAQRFVDLTPAAWDSWQHTPGVECVHVHPSRMWQVWSDGRSSRGRWLSESRPSLPPAPAGLLAVVMGAQNPTDVDPATRRRLFTATAHDSVTCESAVRYAEESRAEVALECHTVTVPSGTVVFWRVVSADGGCVGGSAEVASVYLDKDAAHANYVEQCRRCGLGRETTMARTERAEASE